MAELARWCRAQSLSETMTNAVIKAFVDLDSLRSCANDPGMVDEGLKEQNLPLALRMKVVAPTFEKDVLAETPSSAAPAAGRRRRTRPVPGSLPAVTPVPPARPRPTTAAVDGDEPPRRKKPCFGPSASLETLADVESRFPGALPPQ